MLNEESVKDVERTVLKLRVWEIREFALLEGFGYIICTGGGCSNSSNSVGSYRCIPSKSKGSKSL